MFKRKIASTVLTAAMVLSMLPFGSGAVFADTGDGSSETIGGLEAMAADFEKNLATFETLANANDFLAPIEAAVPDAIQIDNAEKLAKIGADGAYPLNGSYVLAADIDLSGYNSGEWVPIGMDAASAFTGVFDGQGHVISNLKITDNAYGYNGLFGYTSEAAIKNVGLKGVNINIVTSDFTSVWVGGICGYAYSSVSKFITISNCYNTGSISVSTSGSTFANIGGVFGEIQGSVSNCYNTGNISVSEFIQPRVGGVGGLVYGSVNGCYNAGTVSASASGSSPAMAGGICGFFHGSVNNCYNTGPISAPNGPANRSSYAGGICGELTDYGSVNNCYNAGDISAAFAGGICGSLYGSDSVSVNNCYNTGAVSSSVAYLAFVGGICGVATAGGFASINNCYSTGAVSASSSGSGAYAGGICGSFQGGGSNFADGRGYVNNCYNTGFVSASSSAPYPLYSDILAGGICGYAGDYSSGIITVSNCVSLSGKIEAQGVTESIIGNSLIVADAQNIIKSNNLAIEGDTEGNPVDDTGNGEGGARISLEQAKQQNIYAGLGWDFDKVWIMVLGYDFPQLRPDAVYEENGNDEGGNGGNENGGDNNGNDNNTGGGSYTGGGGGGGTAPTQPEQEKPAEESGAAPEENASAGDAVAFAQFTDVNTHWAASAIEFVISNGLLNGVSADNFAPDAVMTRAMFATVLSRHAGGTAAGTASFGDVPAGKWYTDGVLWAAESGIVSGTGNGLFDPDGPITREQLIVMLYNYAKYANLDIGDLGALSAFIDQDTVSAWAEEAMRWAVAEGLISGRPGGLLDPKGTATRAEVATILQRFITD